MPKMTRQMAESYLKQSTERLAEIARLENKFGKEPAIGSIIRMRVSINGHKYDYAIIGAVNSRWYASGPRSGEALDGLVWEHLLDWLNERTGSVDHFEVIGPPAWWGSARPAAGRKSASHQDQDLPPRQRTSQETLFPDDDEDDR